MSWKNPSKLEKLKAEIYFTFFYDKKVIYLSLGLQKGRPATGETFSPQKKKLSSLKTMEFINFYIFVGHFCLPGPDSESGSTDVIESGSNPNADQDPQHCKKAYLINGREFDR